MTKTAKKALKRAHKAERTLGRRAGKVGRHPVLAVAGKLSEVADQPPLIALSVATIVAGAAMRSPAVTRTGVRMLASHLLATGVKTVLKRSIDRTRPKAAERDGYTLKKGGDHGPDLASFPSGHTAGAVAVARAIRRDLPETTPLGAAAATAIGAIQVPRGTHYPSDVLVGAAIGAAAEAIVSRVMARVETKARALLQARRAAPILLPDRREEAGHEAGRP